MNSDPLSLFEGEKIRHWVIKRKARVVKAKEKGEITFKKLAEAYGISVEEYLGWKKAVNDGGLKALKVTHVQRQPHGSGVRRLQRNRRRLKQTRSR